MDAALEWGFKKEFGEKWWGDPNVREALADAIRLSGTSSHGVLAESFVDFVDGLELGDTPRWFLHQLREVAMALLANPACGEQHAERLAKLYDDINDASHGTDDEDAD